MTSDDAIPDREELRRIGDHRTRRGRLVTVVVVAAIMVLIPVALLLIDHGAHPVGRVLFFGLIPAALFIAIALPAAWWVRRRRPHWQIQPLAAGAKRETRKAVRRAIRTGHAPDPRIDALAREQADQTVSNTVVLRIYAVILGLQLVLLVVRISADGPSTGLVLTLFGDGLWAAAVALLAVNLSRSRRYLRDHPPGQS